MLLDFLEFWILSLTLTDFAWGAPWIFLFRFTHWPPASLRLQPWQEQVDHILCILKNKWRILQPCCFLLISFLVHYFFVWIRVLFSLVCRKPFSRPFFCPSPFSFSGHSLLWTWFFVFFSLCPLCLKLFLFLCAPSLEFHLLLFSQWGYFSQSRLISLHSHVFHTREE